MKKILSVILILTLTVSGLTVVSYAENDKTDTKQEEVQTEKNNRKKTAEDIAQKKAKQEKENTNSEENTETEKNSVSKNEPTDTTSNTPEIMSDAAILINSNTGKILYEKNSHKRMYPASTTKILTAYIALNKLDLETELTASKTAVDIASDSSKMGLYEGEILTVKDLLYALLVQSANDAANVLAEAVSNSIPEFVELMNQTAQSLGMSNSNFANPHGYHDENHYTTAYDMSLIAQKAMENPTFAEIVSTKSITIPPTNKYDKERIFSTRNSLINPKSSSSLQYRYANGIKTGHTSASGQCLVGSAKKNGMDLITVVFHAPENIPNRVYTDTKNLFEYAYTNYSIKAVLTADELASTCNVKWARGKSHLVLKANNDVKVLIPKENYNAELLTSEINIYDNIVAPIKENDELGEVKYYYDNEELITAKLYASRDVSKSLFKQIVSYVLNIWSLLILGIVAVILVLRRIKEIRRIERMRRIRRKQTRGDFR